MPPPRPTRRPIALLLTLVAGFAGQVPAKAGAVEPNPRQAARAAPAVQQPAAAPFAVLRGRVTSKAGAPLSGVRVRVAIPAADMRFVDPSTKQMQLEARSGEDGEYRLEFPGFAGRTKVSIDAMMPGFRRLVGTLMAGGDAKTVELDPSKATEADLVLEPSSYFAGTVVDEQGKPIAGAKVFASFVFGGASGGIEITATGPGGSFEVFNYPVDPANFRGQAGRGFLFFSHPDYVEVRMEGVDAIEPDRRGGIRVVLPTGRMLSGTVLDSEGKPVAGAMVEAALETGGGRKGTIAGADGGFALRGLLSGPTTLAARSLEIKQKARLPIPLDADKADLQVRLGPIPGLADAKVYPVLGMQLASLTPGLKAAYDSRQGSGAMILDPGANPDRLNIGELAEGYTFWMVGNKRVAGVPEFVAQILREVGAGALEEYKIRVVYDYKTAEEVGNNTQYLKLTRADVEQLRALAERLKADAR